MKSVLADIVYLKNNKIKTRRFRFGNSQEEEECNICYTPLSSEAAVTTPCNHIFHTRCLCSWLGNNKKSCPYCRREFNPEEIKFMCPEFVIKPPAKRKLTFEDLENPATRRQLGIAPQTTVTTF